MIQRFVKKLPAILQTDVQKEFYAATFDQLFSSADVEQAQGFIGRRGSEILDPTTDNYLDEPTKLRAAYQLEPIAYAVNAALQDTNQYFYEDVLNYLEYRGGNTLNHDRLFADLYYSFAPPIDYDKFLNYQNYLWLDDGGPIVFMQYTGTTTYDTVVYASTGLAFDALIEDLIIGATTFNTSSSTDITPLSFDLSSGMRVRFEGSILYDRPYWVEGIGRSIRLVAAETNLLVVPLETDNATTADVTIFGYDGEFSAQEPIPPGALVVPDPDHTIADYITIERSSCDGSAWTRTNRWLHEDAVDSITLLGQLLGGTIRSGFAGIGYLVGQVVRINIGDGADNVLDSGLNDSGSYIINSVDPGGIVTSISVFDRGQGYSFATVDETGAISPSVPMLWDSSIGEFWDLDNTPFVTIEGQDETNYDNVGDNGTFFGGTGYNVSDVLTMSDGTTITVDAEVGNVVTEFTITTRSTTVFATSGTVHTTLTGNADFTLTTDVDNEYGAFAWDNDTTTSGAGAGLIIDSILASAVSRANKGTRPILEFKRDLELYNMGNKYIGEVNVVADIQAFTDIHTQPSGLTVDGIVLVDGMRLIFLDPASVPLINEWDDDAPTPNPGSSFWDTGPWELEGATGAVTKFIWQVDLVSNPGVIELVRVDITSDPLLTGPTVPTVNEFEVVLATQGQVYQTEMFYQKENVGIGDTVWTQAQGKNSRNKQPLFTLYDTDGISLDDTLQYPASDFVGNEVFSYKILTQARLQELGGSMLVNDPVLGFPVETKGLRQLGDILFENDMEVYRTTYTPVGGITVEANGYYFFKIWTVDAECNVLDNGLVPAVQLFTHETNWKSANFPEEIRIIDRYLTVTDDEDEFPISGVPVTLIAGPANYVVTQGRRLNTDEFVYIPATQTMKLLKKPSVTQVLPVTPDPTYHFNQITQDLFVFLNDVLQNVNTDYTLSADLNGFFNIVTFPAPIASGIVVKGTQQASGAPGAGEVVEIFTYTFDEITDSELGYFEIPNELENNPNNLEILENSWNEFTPHYTSIITEQASYFGTAFGSGNNYRDTLKDGSLGNKILQNQSPMLKTMLVSQEDERDMIEALRLSSSEYTRFKNRYIKTALQLINEGFTDFNFGDTIPVAEWVDEIIRRITRAREYGDAFKDTYMIAWNNVYTEQTTTVSGIEPNVTLTDFIDLDDKRNALYVYIGDSILQVDTDYNYVSLNPIQIKLTGTFALPVDVITRLYEDSAPAYIPATPSKLGMYQVCKPMIVTDDTYATPIQVIIGHDGSKTPIYNDERDVLLLELENRIYMGIIDKFRVNYAPPLIEETFKPGKFRTTRWTLDEWNDLLKASFFKWSSQNKADYIANLYYDAADAYSWNYSNTVDVDGEQLSGYWRAIFDYYYDTQTPHITPWEMLGLKEMPTWWESRYGATGIYLPSNPVWDDLQAGILRGAIGTTAVILDLYVRPNLKTKYLPVTAAGALQATPLLTIDVTASLTNPSIDEAQADYTWGDNSPVEYAWRTSESYPFALMEALYLARPSEFGEQLWNPEHNFRIPIELLQIVNDDNDLRKRTGNSNLVVHGETVNSIPQIQTGYQVWISNRIRSLKKDITVDFGDLVRSLDVKLGHKMAAFTDSDTLKVFVEGISVSSLATNLLIPSENIDVTLYTGPPVQTYMYSGVLVKAILEDDVQMYQVFGYDLLSGEFEYYPRLSGAGDSEITVGGQPASFTSFETGKNYSTGQIVRLNGIFYTALENHQAITFDNNKWLKLSSLPIRGGVSVTYRKKNAEEKSAISYGTKFSTIQQVFDFLVGYGVAQNEDGWGFDTVNTTNNTIADWFHVAKDYLFWVATQWEQDSILMLSPSAELITLNANEGYPANVEKVINGVFTILDKNGIVIDPINTVVRRDERQLIVTPSIEQTGIYAMRAITRETESIVTFDNVTAFNDIIYDPLLGTRLGRVDFNGRRTLEWTGKLEAAGFIITADGLLPNYENLVNSIRNYHNTEELLDNPTIEAVAHHLIGFEEREYFTSLGILDDAAFQFYQGMVREKGTSRAVEKMERNKLVTDTDNELTIIEEWALKLEEWAGVCANQYTEFLIAASEVKVDPQLVQLSYPASQQGVAPRYVFDGLVSLTGSAPVTYPITDDSPTTFDINGTTTVDLAGIANFVTLLSTLNADAAFTGHGMTADVTGDGRLVITTSLDTVLDRDITITASTASVPTELFIVDGVTTNPRQINTTTDIITIADHGYRSGEPKFYDAGGGTAIGGLVDDTVYYIVVLTDDTFQFALTKTDALAATPLVIILTGIGTGDQHSLVQWSTGTVDEIVLLSATNVWVTVPQIFIVNHPDDTMGSGALAIAVLDTDGLLLRIDMIAGGAGYTEVPRVNIGAGALADDSDRAIASLEFDIVTDTAGDDVILIDVDDETRWITKPDGAACNIADELWPANSIIEYDLPNSGYVHLDDIDFQAFGEDDIDALGLLPASPDSHGDLIHVARDAREGFAVFYLDNYHASTIDDQTQALFDGTSVGQGTFFGGTGYVVGEDVTLSDGTVINVDTEASGVVTGFTILTNTRTAFFPARGGHVLTTTSSTSTGNDDFTLTVGILNESEGSSLATGIGATLTQTPLIANDGQVTMTSAPREDVLEATVTIDVDGTGGVTGVTVTDGGLGYVLAGSFTISSLTHGAERNDNETDAIISYSVSSTGQMELPVVSTAGTAYARNVATVAINAIGSGYSIADILTVVGGTGVVATMTVDEVSTIVGNDETDFANIPTTEGTFEGGTGHAAADVITLTDGSTITVDVATASTIAQQTETDYDNSPITEGTFAGGSGYVVGDIMTMTDGSVVQVTSETANVIDGFTIVSESSSSILIGDTLTVLILPASGGVNFTITVDTDNVKYPATFGVVTGFTITTATTTGIAEQEATVNQASTGGAGINFALNMGVDNQGVFLPTILNAGAYTATLPALTGAATTVSPAGGLLATVDLTFIGLGIPVNTADVNNPEGYLRYLGNESPGSGTIYANNILYDYVHISGLDYTLSKNGTAILDSAFEGGATTGFTTLVNLRFRTVAERTVFNADLDLIGATQTWTDDNGSGLWEASTLVVSSEPGPVTAAPGFIVAMTTFNPAGEGAALGLVYTSDNDVDVWSSEGINLNIGFPSPGGIAYAASIDTWVAITKKGNSGADNLSYSTDDGVTWTSRLSTSGFITSTGAIKAIDWSPTLGLFCVGGNSGDIERSSDGITWVDATPGIFGFSQVLSIHWSETQALFFASTNNGEVGRSSDGSSWTLTATEPGGATTVDIDTISTVGSRLFAGRDNGTVYWSDDDGDSWTQSTITGTAIGSADPGAIVGNSDGSVIVIGAVGLNNAEFVWRSTDNGLTFASVDVATQLSITNLYSFCLTFDADYGFIQGGRNADIDEQNIITSPDGLTWTVRLSEKGTHFDSTNNPVTITRSGSTATVTSGSDPFLSIGLEIVISGANQPEYNGTFTITGAPGNDVEYTVSGTPTTPATGTIEMRYIDRVDITSIAAKNLAAIPGVDVAVYTYSSLRAQEELIETEKFVNAYVYENDTKDTLAQIPVYDPFKGIIPGNAALNIRYKSYRDPARYTNASTASLINEDLVFDGDQVGEVWWDLSTCAYLYYEQDTDVYRRDNWGTLFNGSSIDIYEWARSTTLPSEWTGDGIVRNTTDYVVLQEWDPILEEVRTFYYFWVKDRTEIPGVKNRTIAGFEIANIITNPAANLYQWFSPVSQTGFMFSGVDSVFTDSDNIFQINYRRQDDERPTHVEWELGRENDPSYIINTKHWDKMVDSICGYTDEVDIGASAFLDIIASFETDATSVITAAPDMIVCNVIATFVTDITGVNAGTNRIGTVAVHGLTTGDPVVYTTRFPGIEDVGLTDGVTYYVNVVSTTTFSLHTTPTNAMSDLARVVLNVSGAETHGFASAGHGLTNAAEIIYSATGGTAISTLVDEGNYFVEVITPTAVALHPTQSTAATANPGTRIDIAPLGSETHTLTEVVMALHNFNNAIPSASDPTKGYLVVPDPNISEQNQQGIRLRPLQTMFLDILGARRVFVDKVNDLVETIILRDENPLWNAGLTTNNLWEWVDWYEVDFDPTNAVPIRQVEDTSDLQALPNPFDGDIVKVTGTRWSLYIYDIDTGLYSLIAREASRLTLLTSIYVDSPSLATALELRELILALQTEVFVNARAINNNLLFFALLNYVFSEQDDIDWVFKTTYIFLDQTGQVLTQDRVFQDDPFDSALEYIDEAKPYQTKVRDFRITRATEIDEVNGTAEETKRNFNIFMVYDQIRGGDLSVTEMRIAKSEGSQNTSYKGYSLVGPPDVRLGAAGRYVASATTESIDIPLIVSANLADYDPGQLGPIPSLAELEAVATINAAITEEFFFDYQGSLLQNTSFGGLPTLKSAVLSNPGTGGYLVGDILELDAGGGVPITAAIIRVDTIGGGGIATFSIINGGSYQQTPTSDPVLLIGGSGNGDASLTTLIFENGSSVPHDTTPWDQIGFESSVFDPSVTTLDGLGSSPDNVFAAIPSEETFSGNGSQKEFDLTTTVPTFFMFAVVDGVEQTLNVDYFFIGTTLTFVSILESDGSRGFGAPPNGTNNIELYTYIEAGDLINPQVRAGVSEEMVPLDPRENLIVIADTQNITLVAGGTGYALGEVLTLTAGTFTQAMTVEVTSVTGGIIDPGGIVLIDSGEYTVLPVGASAVTSNLAGNDDATITAEDISLSFRIHNDTRQNYDITRNADSMSTTLTASIGLTDTVIPVVDETLLYTTSPTVDAPQVAWIGTERIIFHGINATANEISGCIRGTAGTHAQTHVGNADPLLADKIFGTEGQAVPVSPYVYWVDSATVAYDAGIAGQWRYTGVGNVHFSDSTDLDMHTGSSMIVGDSLRVTTGAVVNKTYFMKDLIIKGEVCIIDVTTPGTGYSVGDAIDLTGLGGAVGATAIVGGIGVAGSITYVTITNRGTAGVLSADTINIVATGNGDAIIDVFYDREGLVLALAGNIIDPNGIVVELDILSWETDRLLPGGLTDATSAAALFLQAQAGNALSLPAP